MSIRILKEYSNVWSPIIQHRSTSEFRKSFYSVKKFFFHKFEKTRYIRLIDPLKNSILEKT